MSKRPQDTSAEEPDGGNPHIRFRGGPRQGDRPGLLNSLVRWEPFREMEEMFRHYAPLARARGGGDGWTPTANIVESDKEYLIKAELPEVKKEDVQVNLAGKQ